MTTQDVAAQPGSSIDSRLGCSTISFRAWTLPGALADISGQGFGEIDLGALPGVCDHVPTPLPPELVDVLAEQILASGLAVKLITADVAEMNDPGLDAAEIQRRLADPGRPGRGGWYVDDQWPVVARAPNCAPNCPAPSRRWLAPSPRPPEFVGRFGDDIAHVHIPDAVPGNINLSVGNGQVDFARGLKALADAGLRRPFHPRAGDPRHHQRHGPRPPLAPLN